MITRRAKSPLAVKAHRTKWTAVVSNMAGEVRVIKKFDNIFDAGQWGVATCADVGEFVEMIPPKKRA